MNLDQWNSGRVKEWDDNLGTITFNLNIPLEWQIGPLACEYCDMEDDCRKCEYFEFSSLYRLIEANPELEAMRPAE